MRFQTRRVLAALSLAALACVFVLGGCPDGLMLDPGQHVDGIKIRGGDPFVGQTLEALQILRDNAPDAYSKVQTYIAVIEESEHSGMAAYLVQPTFEVNDRTAFYSPTWYAGAIAHDATHSQLYHEYAADQGLPVPEDAWTGPAKELVCLKYQLDVAGRIGAPQYEIDWIASQDGTHPDVDGDIDWNDYNLQDW